MTQDNLHDPVDWEEWFGRVPDTDDRFIWIGNIRLLIQDIRYWNPLPDNKLLVRGEVFNLSFQFRTQKEQMYNFERICLAVNGQTYVDGLLNPPRDFIPE